MREFKEEIEAKIQASKWIGEPCHNPSKGWIRDTRGNRLTRLGNRNAFGKLITMHNNELDLLQSYILNTLKGKDDE